MRKYRAIVFLIINLLLFSNKGFAQKIEAIKDAATDGYNFWLATPRNVTEADSVASPLVVFLHGASLCGKNMERSKRYGVIHAIESGLELDAFCVAPQNPGGAWKPEKVWNVVEYVKQHCNIDSTRIYVLGMSLGGYGTMDVAGTYPDRFAAAMAICGGTSLSSFEGLNNIPLYIVHGTADRAVGIKEARRVSNGIKALPDGGNLLVYSELRGVNHSRPVRLFYQLETYDWLLSHRLGEKKVNRDYIITSETIKKPYHLKR